jgi:hypothetical protein
MPIITPALTITSKKFSTAADAGPTTSPIVISVTDSLAITEVRQKVVDVSDDHAILFDADSEGANIISYTDTTSEAGVDGGFVYLRNLTEGQATTADIYIGHGTPSDFTSANGLEESGGAQTIRLMTLKPGEFSFFAWDLEQDLIVDSNAAADTVIYGALEAIFFIRTTSI